MVAMHTSVNASVLIPTTGARGPELRRAVASVRAQSLQPAEVVVVVDGDHATMAAVQAAVGATVDRVLCTGRRRGVSAARNQAARHSRGEMLCFLDDDDRWKEQYLARAFAEGVEYDIILAGFEKHNAQGVHPEKIPPATLGAASFLAGNPGLRGSNLIVRRSLFDAVEGFDEDFVSFNDVDFGARAFALPRLRYRAVREPLVEYHAHPGERLSSRGATSILPGMLAFLARYESAMSPEVRAEFRDRAQRNWGIDPWEPDLVLARARRTISVAGTPRVIPALFHHLDERLLEGVARGDAEVNRVGAAVDELCAVRAERRDDCALERLRLVVITTDSPGSLEGLLESLRTALTRSRWRTRASTGPRVEVLVVENDVNQQTADAHRRWCAELNDPRIEVRFRPVPTIRRPLVTAAARGFAFRTIKDLGWTPSATEPVWILDEDFRFEQLVPSFERGFRAVPNPSLLHRMEFLVTAHAGVDALVCGNSGAAPVTALGLIRRQLRDILLGRPGAGAWPSPERAAAAARETDSYYDYGAHRTDAARPWQRAWWRDDARWDWQEVARRLLCGLPVSRPAISAANAHGETLWGPFDCPSVSGGNTLLLSPRGLAPEWLETARWRGYESRRADSVWCSRARREGLAILQVSIPLLHDRRPRGEGSVDELFRDAVTDALGVGAYRTMNDAGRLDSGPVAAFANQRLTRTRESLRESLEMLREAGPSAEAAFIDPLRQTLGAVARRLEEVVFDDIDCA
jgi:hypothetical protein